MTRSGDYEVTRRSSSYPWVDETSWKRNLSRNWKGFKLFVWNPLRSTFCGRTSISWVRIIAFYLVYYGTLAGMFAICLTVHLKGLPNDRPKYLVPPEGDQAISKTPGMSARPRGNKNIVEYVVKFDPDDSKTYKAYVDEITDILEEYSEQNDISVIDCTEEGVTNTCPVGPLNTLLGDCSAGADATYGYSTGQPCFLLKLNKLFAWKPKLYETNPDPTNLEVARYSPSHMGVTCEQADSLKSKGTMGSVKYFPSTGFPGDCFPYCNTAETYYSPLVMVKFTAPERGKTVRVWCKAWAENVKHHGRDSAASVIILFKIAE